MILMTSVELLLAQNVKDDALRLDCVGGPMHMATGGGAAQFKFDEISIEIGEDVVLDRGGSPAQILPIRFFGDKKRSLGLDDICCMGDILAQLRIAQDGKCGLGKGRSRARVEVDAAGNFGAHAKLSAAIVSVLARIWAR